MPDKTREQLAIQALEALMDCLERWEGLGDIPVTGTFEAIQLGQQALIALREPEPATSEYADCPNCCGWAETRQGNPCEVCDSTGEVSPHVTTGEYLRGAKDLAERLRARISCDVHGCIETDSGHDYREGWRDCTKYVAGGINAVLREMAGPETRDGECGGLTDAH